MPSSLPVNWSVNRGEQPVLSRGRPAGPMIFRRRTRRSPLPRSGARERPASGPRPWWRLESHRCSTRDAGTPDPWIWAAPMRRVSISMSSGMSPAGGIMAAVAKTPPHKTPPLLTAPLSPEQDRRGTAIKAGCPEANSGPSGSTAREFQPRWRRLMAEDTASHRDFVKAAWTGALATARGRNQFPASHLVSQGGDHG